MTTSTCGCSKPTCLVCVQNENAKLRAEVDILKSRLADSLRRPLPEDYRTLELQIDAIKAAWNHALADGVDITPRSFEKLNHAILGIAEKRIPETPYDSREVRPRREQDS